jgi:predicted Zn finger-like uncharacterized protein
MLIQCPKCHAVYDLPDQKMPPKGLRIRCAECLEIWTALPTDALKETKKETTTDIRKMFENVAKETEDLFEVKRPKNIEKAHIEPTSRSFDTLAFVLSILLWFAVLLGVLYCLRYEIVRILPQTEQIYTRLGIESVPFGKNLEIQSVVVRQTTENNIAQLQVNGVIVNVGRYASDLPQLQIDVYDSSDTKLESITYDLSLPRLEAGYHMLFQAFLPDPTAFDKAVYVRFADQNLRNRGE